MTSALGLLGADTDSTAFGVGKVAGEIAGTAGIGGGAALGLRAAAPSIAAGRFVAPALSAVESGGVSSGGVGGLSGLGVRALGGAAVGAGASGMSGGGKDDATQAAFLGAMLPMGLGAAGKGVALATGIVKPWTGGGQSRIVGDILRQYSHDPEAALAALQATREVVPGSMPITAAAAGDVGLSGLTRTMQASNNITANELALRASNQNNARTGLLESVAGNPGKIAVAKEARNNATGAMREQVLSSARPIDANGILGQLDSMLANPNNAGATARGALDRVRSQVASFAGDTGAIDARALYEIRKDVGLAMQGKLQGEAGNLKYAKGVLGQVQSMFDDAISSAVPKPAAIPGNSQALQGAENAAATSPGQWQKYLQTYAEQSKPVNQMEALQDVLKGAQTGSTDMQGNLIISSAKLNNVLKSQSDELAKILTPQQMQTLHNVAADANAARLGLESGKALGSNTVQNLSQGWLLNRVLGRYGESPLVSSVMKKPLGLLYGSANEKITDQLSEALLNPDLARRLMEQSANAANPVAARRAAALGMPAARGLLSQ
jgi:hypothetical protein